MHTNNTSLERKPFPWRCGACREQAVYGATVDCVRQMHYEGREYTVKVDGLKTPKCVHCGQVMLDSEALEVLEGVFIRQLNILLPAQIHEYRLSAKLTQAEVADAVGVSESIVAMWEAGGVIQTRSQDHLLRLFFGLPQVREILTTHQISTLPVPVQ